MARGYLIKIGKIYFIVFIKVCELDSVINCNILYVFKLTVTVNESVHVVQSEGVAGAGPTGPSLVVDGPSSVKVSKSSLNWQISIKKILKEFN